MTAKSRVQVKCPKCDFVFLPSKEEIQSRAGSSSRKKGANFERNTAKKFKKWWPGDYDWKRTPMSGGSALKEGFDMAGDVCTNAPDFIYHLELKNSPGQFKGWHQFFTTTNWKLWAWLKQAEDDCPSGRIPILIVNRFDQPAYCIVDLAWFLSIGRILSDAKINCLMYSQVKTRGRALYIWSLDDMLASDPELWK
jgi:hypothetical protein